MAPDSRQPAVTHVFVLMLENRSFDHLLGCSAIKGRDASTGDPTSIRGLTDQSNRYDGSTYAVHSPAVDPMTTDPGHMFMDTLEQLCGAGTANPFPHGPYPPIDNSGFVANYATFDRDDPPTPDHYGDVMASCNATSQVPALTQLATEFAVCDAWFSSVPGSTWPNRFFATTGTSLTLDENPTLAQGLEWLLWPGAGFPGQRGSIFGLLADHGLDWRIYNDRWSAYSREPKLHSGVFPIVSALQGVSIFDVHDVTNLAADLADPYPYQLTFIEPNYGDVLFASYGGGSSQHPLDSLAAGDALLAAVYQAIRQSPIWDTSLLIVTHDEHGGFYDHMEPPAAVPPGDKVGSRHKFDFARLGVRVPAVVVSPLVPPHTIDHRVYDHSSMLRSIEALHGLPALTHRDATARGVGDLLSLPEPRPDCSERLSPASPAPPAPDRQPTPMASEAPIDANDMLPGHLILALAAELELATTDGDREDLVAAFRSLDTVGDAAGYFEQVLTKVEPSLAE